MMLLLLLATAVACNRSGDAKPKTSFSGETAMGYVKTQLDFGPRVPGTAGHRKTGDWIIAQMKQRSDTVVVQEWTHVTQKGDTLPLRNILARFNPSAEQRILYITHWDTRPVADSDPILGNRGTPIPGANDGASGVALLMAIGDVLKKERPGVGVDLLFVDGEDWGQFGSPLDNYPDVLIGSRYFAAHLPSPNYRPMFGVLFDMIGDANLNMPQEQNSLNAAPEVVARVWDTAEELGYGKYFQKQGGYAVDDDHIPLIKAGLRVIDVIDIDYGPLNAAGQPMPNYHHTLSDTIDKISAQSLQVVGDVAVAVLKK